MDNVGVRYASALYSLAKEDDKIIEYQMAMKSLHTSFLEDEEVLVFLSSAFIDKNEKYKLIKEISEEFNLRHLYPFLRVLVDNHRINDFKMVYQEYNYLANDYRGIDEGFVYSTTPLSEEKIHEIEDAIATHSKKKIELVNKIDHSLIGGIKVIVHDRVYDASIKNKVEALKSKLMENR